MGCELSVKYPEICLEDEAKLENLMKKYCGRSYGSQELQKSNSNFGNFDVVTDQLRAFLGLIQTAWNASCWEWPLPS